MIELYFACTLMFGITCISIGYSWHVTMLLRATENRENGRQQ